VLLTCTHGKCIIGQCPCWRPMANADEPVWRNYILQYHADDNLN